MFRFIKNRLDLKKLHTNYYDYPPSLHETPLNIDKIPQISFDRQLNEYSLNTTHPKNNMHGQSHNQHLFMCITHCKQHELDHYLYFTYFHDNTTFTSLVKDVLSRYPHIKPDITIQFQGFWFDGVATQFDT